MHHQWRFYEFCLLYNSSYYDFSGDLRLLGSALMIYSKVGQQCRRLRTWEISRHQRWGPSTTPVLPRWEDPRCPGETQSPGQPWCEQKLHTLASDPVTKDYLLKLSFLELHYVTSRPSGFYLPDWATTCLRSQDWPLDLDTFREQAPSKPWCHVDRKLSSLCFLWSHTSGRKSSARLLPLSRHPCVSLPHRRGD